MKQSQKIKEIEASPITQQVSREHSGVFAFHQGSPGHGCHSGVAKAFAEAGINQYSMYITPHYGSEDGRRAGQAYIYQRYGLELKSMDTIHLSSGFTNFFKCLCETILGQGSKVIVFEPVFPQYMQPIALSEAQMIRIKTNEKEGWVPKTEDLKKILKDGHTELLIFNYPNNPSGATLSRKQWNEIIDLLLEIEEENKLPLILCDDAYVPLIYDRTNLETQTLMETIVWRLEKSQGEVEKKMKGLLGKVILACSLSKEGIAGSLLGVSVVPNKKILEKLRIVQKSSVINSSFFGELALKNIIKKDQDQVLEWSRSLYQERVTFLFRSMNAVFKKHEISLLPASFRPQAGMYLYVNFRGLKGFACKGKPLETSEDLQSWLINEVHLLAVPFGDKESFHFRFSVGFPSALCLQGKEINREKTEENGLKIISKAMDCLDKAIFNLTRMGAFVGKE